jgi:hypothetical protein
MPSKLVLRQSASSSGSWGRNMPGPGSQSRTLSASETATISLCRSRRTWCYGPIWMADQRQCCRSTLGLSCNEWAWPYQTGQR